ncbi:tetratricopeptide repeat protein, partial [Candidatus Omnitrophota bacterium]
IDSKQRSSLRRTLRKGTHSITTRGFWSVFLLFIGMTTLYGRLVNMGDLVKVSKAEYSWNEMLFKRAVAKFANPFMWGWYFLAFIGWRTNRVNKTYGIKIVRDAIRELIHKPEHADMLAEMWVDLFDKKGIDLFGRIQEIRRIKDPIEQSRALVSLLRNVEDTKKDLISYPAETDEEGGKSSHVDLAVILRDQLANCSGFTQMFYILGRLAGLKVMTLEITSVHIGNLVQMGDGRVFIVDMGLSKDTPPKISNAFYWHEEYEQIMVDDAEAGAYHRLREGAELTNIYDGQDISEVYKVARKLEHAHEITATRISVTAHRHTAGVGGVKEEEIDHKRALAENMYALSLNPNSITARANRVLDLVEIAQQMESKSDREEFAEHAVLEGREAVRVHPEDSEAWRGLGEAYQLLEMHEEAVRCFLKALRFEEEKEHIDMLKEDIEKSEGKPSVKRDIRVKRRRKVEELESKMDLAQQRLDIEYSIYRTEHEKTRADARALLGLIEAVPEDGVDSVIRKLIDKALDAANEVAGIPKFKSSRPRGLMSLAWNWLLAKKVDPYKYIPEAAGYSALRALFVIGVPVAAYYAGQYASGVWVGSVVSGLFGIAAAGWLGWISAGTALGVIFGMWLLYRFGPTSSWISARRSTKFIRKELRGHGEHHKLQAIEAFMRYGVEARDKGNMLAAGKYFKEAKKWADEIAASDGVTENIKGQALALRGKATEELEILRIARIAKYPFTGSLKRRFRALVRGTLAGQSNFMHIRDDIFRLTGMNETDSPHSDLAAMSKELGKARVKPEEVNKLLDLLRRPFIKPGDAEYDSAYAEYTDIFDTLPPAIAPEESRINELIEIIEERIKQAIVEVEDAGAVDLTDILADDQEAQFKSISNAL